MAIAPIDPSNYFLVSLVKGEIRIRKTAVAERMTIERALNLAAWLVALADPARERFDQVLEAVKN